MAKVNKTKYALLGVLSLMSGSGYDIKKFCDSSIGHFWNENYGHIYPVLQKMEQEGLITKQVEQTEGRPSKNVYSITEEGSEELEKWLMLPVEHEPVRSELLLKIFWSTNIPVENITEKFQQIKEESEKNLLQYLNIENFLKTQKEKVDKKKIVLWMATVNYGKHAAEANLKWCEETLKILEEIKDL
ncbi:PadR family transcriptional regulator [Clostridium uliginosum]|uniref:DNA-binding transcriptional regulator, PadR family n=1 Tax=Clostridium uliginosum TaxID=119641 RepID=A0A1I1P150_9CLOT|nr:PadR family transcriptional regulator [Clostridium uliginosum]SFD03386.1 DNA-binding transcriptional regulator, PadR family [Clostridium uliginosum]